MTAAISHLNFKHLSMKNNKTSQDMDLIIFIPSVLFHTSQLYLIFPSFQNKQLFSLEKKKSQTHVASYFLPWFILYFFLSHYFPIEPTFLII